MKIASKPIACLLAALSLAAVQAKATLLYDNGPINGTFSAAQLTKGFLVSNSFTVTGSASLGSARVGLWLIGGDAPSTIGWSIGTAPFLSDISSGTSSFMNTFLFTNGQGFDIYQSVFNISGAVGVGTYYLTLGNGTSNNNNNFFWDENNGPSTAYMTGVGQIPSESFQIFSTNAVPDAGSSVMLLGIGLAGMGWTRRKISTRREMSLMSTTAKLLSMPRN
jgi:VPDSG-CTERM motif/PEP-CTERM motif